MSFLTVAIDKCTFSFILVIISFHLSIVPAMVCFHDFSTVPNSSIFWKQVPNNVKEEICVWLKCTNSLHSALGRGMFKYVHELHEELPVKD